MQESSGRRVVEPLYVREPDALPCHDCGRRPIRPLATGDLDAIEVIERRAYPTPWSRSMFASELAKPTSICLGAFEGGETSSVTSSTRATSMRGT